MRSCSPRRTTPLGSTTGLGATGAPGADLGSFGPDSVPLSRVLPLRQGGPEPVYYQIARGIEAAVAAGSIKRGMRLPVARRTWRGGLCVSIATIRRAWSYLERRGMIKRARRTGTFIA